MTAHPTAPTTRRRSPVLGVMTGAALLLSGLPAGSMTLRLDGAGQSREMAAPVDAHSCW